MSLETILGHINSEALLQKENIMREAKEQSEAILNSAKNEQDKIYKGIIDNEKNISLSQKEIFLVNARLENRKKILRAKQELIDSIFIKLKSDLKKGSFKKKQISKEKTLEVSEDIDFYLKNLRFDYETDIAKILFE